MALLAKSAAKSAATAASRLVALGLAFWLSAAFAQAPPAEFWVYEFARGDTIYTVSQRYLRNPADWQRLQRFNQVRLDRAMPVGTRLRIPLDWLKFNELDAEVDAVEGNVRVERGGAPLPAARGMKLRSGDRLTTGERDSISFRMSDGSRANVRANSNVAIDAMRGLTGSNLLSHRLRVNQGRIETEVVPRRNAASKFEVATPSAVIGVRGTKFRVAAEKQTRGEVLEGEIGVSAAGVGAGGVAPQPVSAGFGAVIDAAGKVSPPIALLAAPTLPQSLPLQERVTVRILFGAVPGARAYRAQVARDASFSVVIAEDTNEAPATRFSGLPDGDYYLRVRAIDANGLEGRDAQAPFRLKARPEAPFAAAPADRAIISATRASFSWSASAQAESYRFQLAGDATFAKLVHERVLPNLTLTVENLPPGRYYWRLRSLRPDGTAGREDPGPWGDVQSFELRAPPANPEPPALEDKEARFRWRGEPGQSFLFQLARDEKFTTLIAEQSLKEPSIGFPKPAPGTYFMRYRATDADGFVGPFSAAQRFEIPAPPPPPPEPPARPWWLLLLFFFI